MPTPESGALADHYPEQQHVFQFMVGYAAEANRSVQEAGSWIAARLDAPSARMSEGAGASTLPI